MSRQTPNPSTVSSAADAAVNPDSPTGLDVKGLARKTKFPAGTIVFNHGDRRDVAYIIDSGEVHIIDPHGAVVGKLGAGDIFGEMALIDNGVRSATATVVKDAKLFVLSRDLLKERMEDLDPLVGLLVSLLVEHYRIARKHLPESIKVEADENLEDRLRRAEDDNVTYFSLRKTLDSQNEALKELKVEQELRIGLERREFEPFLQPILDLRSKKLVGFESLIRWRHPERGIVFPNDFIGIAERTHVVQFLDRMMLEKACEIVSDLNVVAGDKNGPVSISVNLSGVNFADSGLVDMVRETVQQAGIPMHQIRLEVTESALIADAKQAEQMLNELRALGLGISLDDFGTGYSSLSYLHKFSFDTLKIDRAFISQINLPERQDSKGLDIVRAIVNLAHDFDLKVVAEGIENEADVGVLQGIGCEMGQGYLFGKPLSLADAKHFIQRNLKS